MRKTPWYVTTQLNASAASSLSMAQFSYGVRGIANILRAVYPSGIFGSTSGRAFSSIAVERKSGVQNTDDIVVEDENASLYKRISRLGRQRLSVTPVLDEWLKKGHMLQKLELEDIVKALRKFKKYKQALEVSEWMNGNRGLRLSLSDFAIRLDLIAKVHGISNAENYFKDLPEKAKNQKTYGALLNSYVANKLTEKAEGLMEVIKESGFALKALPYNNMMTLYRTLGQPEKVLSLIQDMKVDNIPPDSFTYKIWMNSCADLSDINGVEKVLDELKRDGRFKYDWSIYSNLSAIYIKEGYIKKAQDALKETEHKIFMKKDRDAYKTLIIMHSKLGDKLKVELVWKKFGRVFSKMTNTDYICMLTALVKLGDIKRVEKYFTKWENDGLSYDIRVPNVLIGAYLTEEMIKKAESLLQHALEKGGKPNYKTWDVFVDGYLKQKQSDEAIGAMKKALSRVKYSEWQPEPGKALAVLNLFEVSGNISGAEDMFRRLRKVDLVNTDTYNSLVRTYIQAGKSPSRVFERMQLDKIEPNEETDRLLKW